MLMSTIGSEEGSGGVLPMEVDDDAMFQKEQVKVGKTDMGQVGTHTCSAVLAPYVARPHPLVSLWSMQHMHCRRGLLYLTYNSQASSHNMSDASSLRMVTVLMCS